MATIQSLDAINAIRQGTRMPNTEAAPNELGKTVVPVMDMTPDFHRLLFVSSGQQSATGSFNLFTPTVSRRTYITSVQLSMVKDATCDIATGQVSLSCSVQNGTRRLATIAVLTLTAQSHVISITFPTPIKIDNGQTIAIDGSFTVGTMSRSGTVTYFEADE